MNIRQQRVDVIRAHCDEQQNHLIDELRLGKISRREFVRRAATAGMALPLAGFIATACDGDSRVGAERSDRIEPIDTSPGTAVTPSTSSTPSPTDGPLDSERLVIGQYMPATGLDPVVVADQAGLAILAHTGEYLVHLDSDLTPRPRLAERWTHNGDGSVWTFTLRRDVTFHDGTPMDADDVAATFNRLADPAYGSNALAMLRGALSEHSAQALDPTTVQFTLDAPHGNFPHLVSSGNYNAVILPKDFDSDAWDQTFMGTGPWRLDSYRPDEGVTYVPNEQYWDGARVPQLSQLEVLFLPSERDLEFALLSGEIHYLSGIRTWFARDLSGNPEFVVTALPSAAHRQVHMRVDRPPLADKRVRQAIALLMDRDALIDELFRMKADVGNDSPFAPVYPSTSREVPQRQQDIAKAKTLLEAAGVAEGVEVKLETWEGFEMPGLAGLLKSAMQSVDIDVELSITDAGTYYGSATYGSSPWLDSTMGITEYGHRSVPNVALRYSLGSDGSWNSAHFKNEVYDGLVADYIAAIDLDTERRAAKKIQELLLDEVPVLYPYFYDFIAAARADVAGVETTVLGQADFSQAAFK